MTGDYYGLAGRRIDDPTAVDGTRFIATRSSWLKITKLLRETVGNCCEQCGQYDEHGDCHHVYGRKLGGGTRDDRPVVWYGDVLIRMILYLCRRCHEKAVIKPWMSWRTEHENETTENGNHATAANAG
jgi:hypothetical protein